MGPAVTCDPYWADVCLLYHFDSTVTVGSTTYWPDSGPQAYNTPVQVYGTTSLDLVNFEFGPGSCSCGSDTGVLVLEGIGSAGFNPGLGDVTIEGWVYSSDTSPWVLMTNSGLYPVEWLGNGSGGYTYTMWGQSGSGASGLPRNTWTHFAFVMASNNLQLYLGGVHQFATPLAITGRNINDWSNMCLGGSGFGPSILGNFDEVRVTNFARYTGDFTPTGPFPDGPCSTVPDVTGDDLTTATAAITGAGFVVGTLSYAYSNTVPLGDVISQVPVGGALESPGYTINLTLSLGPPAATVPDVTGDDLATATAAITGVGLVVGTIGYIPNVALVGTVVDQNPVAGTSVPLATPVSLDLSLGSAQGGAVPNLLVDEAIYGAYFGGQLNLVEFTYMPGRTPFEQGATNLIINRYKQEPTDVRQRGVDFTQFVVPGELLQSVAVTGISAQGVPQGNTSPLVTPLVVTNVVIDPVTSLKFGFTVSGGQNGVEYTVQFTCTTNIQTQTLEEVFSINVMIEDMFP